MSSRNAVIEGEASETDDEEVLTIVQSKSEADSIATVTDSVDDLEVRVRDLQPTRARVHVDEKMVQRWRLLGADALTVSWRAVQPQIKRLDACDATISSTFTTLQASSQALRRATEALCRVERNLSAVVDGAALLPDLSSRLKH